ncbi:MAG: endonuclease MutS2 [Clostridia bacterium]|nr:endonuclease MutS2 [Clostridia bacterium]
MNERIYKILEFNKVKEILKNYAVTYLGRERCDSLLPSTNSLEIEKWQNETEEALSYYLKQHDIPLSPISNIDEILNKTSIGGILSIEELLKVSNTLFIARRLKNSFTNGSIDENEFPILSEYFENIYTNQRVEEEISRCIKNEVELDDRASTELYKIRKSIKDQESQIKEKLNSLIHSKAKFLQDTLVTFRDDRYVIPVKAEYKNEVPGLIHNQSATGGTIFIEPTAVFNLNNEIKELKLKEFQEIQRILALLSQMIAPICENIRISIDLIGKIDFAFAKGKYAGCLNAYPPVFDAVKCNLKKARHPLIPQESVVPIDIYFGDDIKELIITGPNTGGKTVTLKTVGLLCLMAQSGLHIPANEGSTLKIFSNIFCDIGDEQSIEQNLSTFSAHMTNIVNILNNVTSDDLVIIDEIGAGTDPVEGAAIAMAILEYLFKQNCICLATTHYSELKSYAINTQGVENASCEFDIDTLRPTYKLLIGIPGKSNAFAISKKLGLKDDILTRANDFLSDESIKFEDVITTMEYDKRKAEEERELSKKMLKEAQDARNRIKDEEQKIEKRKTEILNKAKQQARDILLDAEDTAKNIIKDLNKMKNSNKANNKQIEEHRTKLKKNISEMQKDLVAPSKIESKNALKKENVVIGMNVLITDLEQEGVICTAPDKNDNVMVQSGIIKLKCHISQLEEIKKKEDKNRTVNQATAFNKSKDLSTEINLIGMTKDEAIPALEKYIDDAYLSNVGSVRIVHGKGAGILKRAVHEFLKNHPNVRTYRLGVYGEGDTGVTIAELK